MELFGLRHIMTNPANMGTDTSPAQKTYNPHIRNRHHTWSRASGNLRGSRPLKKNFAVSGHESVNELTAKKVELIDEIKLKLRGEKSNDKLKKKLERDFKIKEQELRTRVNKQINKLKLEREKIAKKNVKN
ncbi:MAG: hypothetical protein ACC656_08815, partial [Candidatus Heimdallarchaeota archaeon]